MLNRFNASNANGSYFYYLRFSNFNFFFFHKYYLLKRNCEQFIINQIIKTSIFSINEKYNGSLKRLNSQ